jgi:flavin-binding protein dodecin
MYAEVALCEPVDVADFKEGGMVMSEHVYKKIELVGSSPNGVEDAVRNAVAVAGQTIRNMRWFEVVETRGKIEDNKINHWQVTVEIGFKLDKEV